MTRTKTVKQLLDNVRHSLDEDDKKVIEPYLRQILDIAKPVTVESSRDRELTARLDAKQKQVEGARAQLQQARADLERVKGKLARSESRLIELENEGFKSAVERTAVGTPENEIYCVGLALVVEALLSLEEPMSAEEKYRMAKAVFDRIDRLILHDPDICALTIGDLERSIEKLNDEWNECLDDEGRAQ